MSCRDCQRNQMEGNAKYYRFKNASVLMSGCDPHLAELFEILMRHGPKAEPEKDE